MDKNQLKAIEKLCRISLSDAEEEIFVKNLDKILNAMTMLQQVDTEGVEPCNHVIANFTAPLREDEPEELLSHQDLLMNAPDHVGGMIRVPQVMQEGL